MGLRSRLIIATASGLIICLIIVAIGVILELTVGKNNQLSLYFCSSLIQRNLILIHLKFHDFFHAIEQHLLEPYNPYIISIGIVVLLLLLISLGICLYSCSWRYFLDCCVMGILFGFNTDEGSDAYSSTDAEPNKNNRSSIEGPPNYETLAGIQTIYNPHHITIKNQIVANDESLPPNYEDIDLSS